MSGQDETQKCLETPEDLAAAMFSGTATFADMALFGLLSLHRPREVKPWSKANEQRELQRAYKRRLFK